MGLLDHASSTCNFLRSLQIALYNGWYQLTLMDEFTNSMGGKVYVYQIITLYLQISYGFICCLCLNKPRGGKAPHQLLICLKVKVTVLSGLQSPASSPCRPLSSCCFLLVSPLTPLLFLHASQGSALTIPSAWNILQSNNCMACSLTFFFKN